MPQVSITRPRLRSLWFFPLFVAWYTFRISALCDDNGIEHRLTKPNHPWTNGQVERMNRTLKEAAQGRCCGNPY